MNKELGKWVIWMADDELTYDDVADLIPQDIFDILKQLAYCANLNNGNMKWNEVARLKCDLMQNWQYWSDVNIGNMAAVMADLGFSVSDIRMMADFIDRRRQGRRLVPARAYRDMPFIHEVNNG